MRIALDVDGVLADVIVTWLDYSNTVRDKIRKHEITDWDFWKRLGIGKYDFYGELDLCWKDWICIPPTEPNLSDSTKRLSELGHVDVVTARNRSTDGAVKSWLGHHGIAYENYVSVASGSMKADLDYDVFIDDSPLNASRIIRNKKGMVLYSQPWNEHLAEYDSCRVANISEAAARLSRL